MHKFIEQKSGINKVKTVVAAVAIAILTGCSSGSGDGSSDVTPVTPVESLSSSSDNILVMGASMQISVTTKAEKSTLRIGKESSEVHDLKFNFKNAQYNDKFTILYGNSCSHFSSLDPCVITLLPKSSAVDLLGENIEYTISGVIGPSANRSTIQGSFILKSLTSTITGNEYRTGLGAGHSATISISNQTGKVVDLSKSQLVSQDPDLSFSQNNCTSIISNDQNCTIVVNASSQSNSKKVAFDLKNQYGTTVLSSAVPIVRPIISISSSLEENQKLLPNEEMALTVKNVSPVSALSLKLNKTLAEGVKISSNTCQEILPALSQCTISLQAGSFANGKSNFIVNGNNFNQVEHSVLAYTPLWMSVALSRHHLVTNNLADKKLIVTVENTSSNLDLHNINLSFSTPISDLEVISRLSSCKHLQDNTLIPKATCRYTLSYQPDSIQSVQSLDTTLIIKDDEHHQVSEAISINHYPAYYSIPNNLKRYHQNIAGSHVNDIYIQNKHIYAATASGLSISKDEGKTWQNKTVADGLLSNDIRAVFVFDNTIYAATASGLSISKDEGKTWQNKTVADGLASNNLTAVYVSNSDIYAASASGLSISKDGGKTWEKQTAADGLASDNINDIYVFSNTIYAATSSGLSISKDEGKTWITRTISNGLPSDNIQNVYVTKGYIIDGDPSIYVATSNGISVSNNEGESWESYLQDKYIHAVYVKGAYIYAATESGLYISDDNYKNWQIKTTTDGLGNNIINQVVLSDDKVYVATIGGLSISKDNAKTWNNHTSSYPFENEIIRDVYYKNGVIYLASSSGGIYISKDGGVTWKNATVENGLGSNLVWRIYVEGNTIYAATHDGLSISYDDGANWQNKTVADGLVSNYIRDVIAEGDRIYVATMKGVSMSEDAGKTWSSPITSTDMQGLFISQGILYAASLDRGIYISKDNGTNWSNVQIKDGDSLFNRASGLYVNSGIIYVATAGGIAISKDEGKNWDYQVLSQNETIGVIEIEVSGSTMYALTSKNGLYTSKDNGVTWTIKTPANGVSSHSINSIAISGSNIYLGTTKGLSVTTKTAEGKWENHVITSDVNNHKIYGVYVSGNTIYAASFGHGVFVSKDNGKTWEQRNKGLGSVLVNNITMSANVIYAATEKGLAISYDGGYNWVNKTKENSGLISDEITNVYAIGNSIYVASYAHGISVSHDGGKSWINSTTEQGLDDVRISDIFTTDNGEIYAATYKGVAISKDGGKTWKTYFEGMSNTSVHGVYVANNTIYAATSDGLSISKDDGKNWENISESLPYKVIGKVYVVGKRIYLASDGGGVFISKDDGKNWEVVKVNEGLGDNRIHNTFALGSSVYAATFNGLSIAQDLLN